MLTARKEVEVAKKRYKQALMNLNWADHDLIDAATLEVEAAKERLNAAIKRAKLESLVGERFSA